MAANFETGFSANGIEMWHHLGTVIRECPSSEEAIKIAGLDWDVVPKPIFDEYGREIPGYKVNQRSSDGKNLGIVSNRYKIVQNREAFAFTDALLGGDVRYETAGSLASGKRVWMMARLEDRLMCEEDMSNWLVFTNQHDGTGAVRVACVSVRIVCENTLNLALRTAKRHWSCAHKGDIQGKLDEARYTLESADRYMKALEEEFGELKLKKVTEDQVRRMTDELLKAEFADLVKKATVDAKVVNFQDYARQQKFEEKLNRKKNDILNIYFDKPDLKGTEHTAFRFINAVSDYATHTTDHKETKNYQENLFMRTVDGNPLIDTAYEIAKVA